MSNQKKLSVRLFEALFPPKAAKREYAAARSNRLNSGWTTYPTTANYETRISLSTLIARSRQAARDDLHIVNYLRLMRANVIGQKGLQLQCQARKKDGKLNVKLNKYVEELWWQWSQSETCTSSGKLDWKGVQDLAVTQNERDGAFLIQMIDARNKFGFSLKTWDVTWLDPTYNKELQNGNRIIMSVEVDAFDKPIAYWMTPPTSEASFSPNRQRQRIRVPAEQVIHEYLLLDDESQVHGIPGTAAALLPAKNAYSYSESVILTSRQCVNDMAVLKNTMADAEAAYLSATNEDGSPAHPQIDSAPLAVTALLPGWEVDWRDPKHPTQNHPAFKQTLDMDIATALGVPYFLLMGDWKAVNFSSSRGGLGEFRERCMSYQEFIATRLCHRVYNEWLRSSWLSGALEITADEFKELLDPVWQPRGFAYVDPTKDIAADVLRLQNRLATPSEIAGERGKDYLTQLERWASDREIAMQTAGINIDEVFSPKQIAAPSEPPKDDTDDDEKPPKDDEAAE